MWSALALDAWGAGSSHDTDSSVAGQYAQTHAAAVACTEAEDRRGARDDPTDIPGVRKPLTISGAIHAITLCVLCKVQRVAQTAVVCSVAIMVLPLVLAGAMVTLFASASVHYVMSGYNNFTADSSVVPASPRTRLRMPSWNSRHFRSWVSDSDSESDSEGEGRVSRWTRRSRIWLRNRTHSITLDTRREEGEDQEQAGRRSIRKALAMRMKRIRGTLKNFSPRGPIFRGSSPNGEQGFEFVKLPGRSLKDKARLLAINDNIFEEILGELPGVDVSCELVQSAIRNVRDSLDI